MNDAQWDQDDEHRRADFQHLLNRMQEDHENAVLAAAETALMGVNSAPVPMPNTAHPAIAQYAAFVRSTPLRVPIRIPKVNHMRAYRVAEDETAPVVEASISTLTLTASKCTAPAPFVARCWDDEAAYFWWVWTDDLGRQITTDAELTWRYP